MSTRENREARLRALFITEDWTERANGVPLGPFLTKKISHIKTAEDLKNLIKEAEELPGLVAWSVGRYISPLTPELLTGLLGERRGLPGVFGREDLGPEVKEQIMEAALARLQKGFMTADTAVMQNEARAVFKKIDKDGLMTRAWLGRIIKAGEVYKKEETDITKRQGYQKFVYDIVCGSNNLGSEQLNELISDRPPTRIGEIRAWLQLATCPVADDEVRERMINLLRAHRNSESVRGPLINLWMNILNGFTGPISDIWLGRLRQEEARIRTAIAARLLTGAQDLKGIAVDELIEWLVKDGPPHRALETLQNWEISVAAQMTKKGRAWLLKSENKEIRLAGIRLLGGGGVGGENKDELGPETTGRSELKGGLGL